MEVLAPRVVAEGYIEERKATKTDETLLEINEKGEGRKRK